jgi:membrane associated rhomboid family serine protease/Flp pilus assembly protein TadD
MANCARCGRELPAFSIGDASDLCRDCQQASRQPTPPGVIEPVPAPAVRVVPRRPPVTTALLVLNVAVFLAIAATAHTLLEPPSPVLLRFGANWGPLSLDGQPWRILTANYVHIGFLHIAFNMWALWQLGWLSERIFGGWTYFLTYTACGIAGSLASLFFHPLDVGAGASGAIFGLVGALISALYLGKLPFPEAARKGLLKNLLIVVAVNLYLGAHTRGIDNSAHLGGLIMGLGVGAALSPYLTAQPDRRRSYQTLIFVMAALLLLGAGSFVQHRNGYVVFLSRAGQTMRKGELDQTIAQLRQAVAKNPRSKPALSLLGEAYLQKKDYASAETALKGVLALDPEDRTAQYNLGLVYGETGRYEEARQVFARLAELNPKDDDVLLLLGTSLDGLGREEEAVQAFQHAIALNSQNSEAFRELGLAQMKLQRTDAAISSLQTAAQLDPKDSKTELALAQAYQHAGRRAEAAAAFRKAGELAQTEAGQARGK